MMRRVRSAIVRGYRLCLRPGLGSACRFGQTCSANALQAVAQHGAAGGSWLTLSRLCRCQPWRQGGLDPVPHEAPRATRLFSRLISPAPPPSSPK